MNWLIIGITVIVFLGVSVIIAYYLDNKDKDNHGDYFMD